MRVYNERVGENMMSRWEFDLTDSATVEEMLGKGPHLFAN